MKRTLVKFDIVHPSDYLHRKQAEWGDLAELSLDEYRARLNALRSNYSDYYTHHLNATGEWEAEEYYLLDPVFADKVAREHLSTPQRLRARAIVRPYRYLWRTGLGYEMAVAEAYLRRRRPDVIFARSQPIPSRWWERFRDRTLLVARLSARLPHQWHPEHFDLVYTDQPDFAKFFRLHGVDTIINDQGFDARIQDELAERPARYDVTFVGGLGSENFGRRTEFLESIADEVDLRWWGYWWYSGRPMEAYPALEGRYSGPTSGLDMYQRFRDSRINLNDYVDTSDGIGFNQRLFECLGSGGFLLTRSARNLRDVFPEGLFETFASRGECLEKVAHYLARPEERAAMAAAGAEFIRESFDYSRIARSFGEDLKRRLR